MVFVEVACPFCASTDVVKRGKTSKGKQRYECRNDEVFKKLRKLLMPFGIKKFYTDDWGSYERHLPSDKHIIGKKNTQKIERKHLTLRTRIKRLARKTICFSKSSQMHDIVIGLFINRYEFGLAI